VTVTELATAIVTMHDNKAKRFLPGRFGWCESCDKYLGIREKRKFCEKLRLAREVMAAFARVEQEPKR